MITQPTVFILGAGASAPYGYPTGAGLKNMICSDSTELLNLLNPTNDNQKKTLTKIMENSNEFVQRYSASPVDLIDSFLEANADDNSLTQAGRILIALSILFAEKRSRFLRGIRKENQKLDWYKNLFELMYKGLKGPYGYLDFKKNRVDFITFNYDRSLEYFLYNHGLLSTYKAIAATDCRPLDLIPFKFTHVYGKIDNFPWEDPPGSQYKDNYNFADIINAADNIKLIHERDDEFLNEIKETIADAKNIFFLGFGYDEDNMRALGWPENFNEDKRILGTAFNLSKSRINEIRAMIQRGFKNPGLGRVYPIINAIDCCRLLDEYRNLLNE